METTLYLLNFILILKTKQKSFVVTFNMILSATRQTYSGGTIQSSKFSPSHIIILNNSAPPPPSGIIKIKVPPMQSDLFVDNC